MPLRSSYQRGHQRAARVRSDALHCAHFASATRTARPYCALSVGHHIDAAVRWQRVCAATCSTTCHLLWLRPRYTGYRPLPMRSPYQRGRQTQRVCTAARWVAYRSLWLALLFIANALSCQRVRQRQRVYAATRSTAYRLLWLRARHTCYGSLPVRRHIHTAVKGGARAQRRAPLHTASCGYLHTAQALLLIVTAPSCQRGRRNGSRVQRHAQLRYLRWL